MRPGNLQRYFLQTLFVLLWSAIVRLPLAHADVEPSGMAPENADQRGFQPGNSYALGEIETINPGSGNLLLHIPIAMLPPGRAGSQAGRIGLFYNSKLYDSHREVLHVPPNSPPPPVSQYYSRNVLQESEEGGWHYGFDYRLEMINRDDEYIGVPSNVKPNCAAIYAYDKGTFQYKVKMAFPDGSKHEFRPFGFQDNDGLFGKGQGYYEIRPDGWLTSCSGGVLVTNSNTTGPMVYYSIDGTFLRLVIEHDSDPYPTNNPWTLYFPDGSRAVRGNGTTFPDGTQVTLGNQRIYDRNNNYTEIDNRYNSNPNFFSTTRIIDQMGRTITITHNQSPYVDLVTAKGANGSDLQWTIEWGGTIITRKYISPRSIGGPDDQLLLNTGFSVVRSITLPSLTSASLKYTFTYNPGPLNPNGYTSGGWGELDSVAMPSGATVDYQYDNDTRTNIDYTWVLDNFPKQKDLQYTPGHDGSSQPVTETWTFALAGLRYSTSTITAPNLGQTAETYLTCCGPSLGYASTTVRPDGTTIERVWKENIPYGEYSYTNRRINAYVKTEFTSVKTSGGTNSSTAIKDYIYDKNGNLLQVVEYDWVPYTSVARSGTPAFPTGAIPGSAVVKKVVVNTYYNPTPDADQTNDDPNVYHKAGSPRLHNAIATSETRSTLTNTVGRTEYTYDNPATTGNLTSQKMWDSTKGALPMGASNSITVSHTYSTAYPQWTGVRTSTTDAKGNVTQYTYAAIQTFPELYVTKKEEAFNDPQVKRTTTYDYDFSSGLVKTVTDIDNPVGGDAGIATITQYDAFGRPTLVRSAAGRSEEIQTETQYDAAALQVTALRRLDANRKLVSLQQYDPLGRLRLQHQMEDGSQDPANGIKVQTRHLYSAPNRYMLVSNPYRASVSSGAGSESTMGWTRTKYDQAGKVLEVESFSGAAAPAPWGSNTTSTGKVTTAYESYTTLGRYTTVNDQALKQRRNIVDGLGRLVRVDEPDVSNSLGGITSPTQATTYTYDAFSNLTQVAQGTQTRTFGYSSLSRLTSAINPESGTTSYTYDDNGNLMSKTDARGVVKTFDPYDRLNRVKRWTYTGGPAEARSTSEVTQSYDSCGNNSKGRLCSVISKDSAGAVFSSTSYSAYDALGRAGQSSQTTNGQALPYTVSYAYNPAGLISQTYPSGLVVKTGYDGAGRIAGISNSDGSLFYVGAVETDAVNRMQYAAHGGLQQMKLANGLWEENRFNARLQALQIGLGRTQTALGSTLSQTNSDYLLLTYTYSATQNNGNLATQRIQVAAATPAPALDLTQSYSTYDSLNRLKTASETAGTGTAWAAITYDFDRYGNRAVTAGYKPVPGQTPQALTEFSTATNRMVAPSVYDATGNQTTDKAGCTTKYDGENKLVEYNCGLGITTYSYDGDGRRVKKVSGGLTTIYVYNLSGQLIAEYSSQGPTGTGISYLTRDHLGSTRVVTDANRSVKARRDYLPYGEEIEVAYGGRASIPGYGVTEGTRQRFTSKERDNESNLDYFLARYYSGAQGRFTTSDPENIGAGPDDPQSWNGYAYARNSPLLYTDPNGLNYEVCGPDRTNCTDRISDEQFAQYRKSKSLLFRGGDEGSIYSRNQDGSLTYVGTFRQIEPDIRPEVAGALGNMARQTGPVVEALGAATLVVTGGIAGAAAITTGGGLTTLGAIGVNGSAVLTNQAAGQIIGWGVGQAGAEVTRQLAQTLTREAVKQMIANGLTRATVEHLVAQYGAALAAGGAKLLNTQLQPRYELMKKILELWPNK